MEHITHPFFGLGLKMLIIAFTLACQFIRPVFGTAMSVLIGSSLIIISISNPQLLDCRICILFGASLMFFATLVRGMKGYVHIILGLVIVVLTQYLNQTLFIVNPELIILILILPFPAAALLRLSAIKN